MTPNNQYGIEKVILDSEAETLELFLKKRDDDPTGKIFAMDLISQRKRATSIGKYKMDSFTIKLPEINHIVMKGRIDNVVDMLKTAEVIDKVSVVELENLVAPMTYSSQYSERNASEIVGIYMTPCLGSSFFATGQGSIVKEGVGVESQKEERESKVINFFKSLSSEGKENIREFLKLLEELPSRDEKEEVLHKLASEGEIPNVKI